MAARALGRQLKVNCASGPGAQSQFCHVGGIWLLPGLKTAVSRWRFGSPQEVVCKPEPSELRAARLPPAKRAVSQSCERWGSSKFLPAELEVWQLPDDSQISGSKAENIGLD